MERIPKIDGYYRFIVTSTILPDGFRLKLGLECGHCVIVRTDVPMWDERIFKHQYANVFCFKCGNRY